MVLVELSSINLSDLPMDAFRAHLRLGTGFSDDMIQDEVLESYIRASMAAIEGRIGKKLLTQSLSWEIGTWVGAEAQALPVAPVSAITQVVIVDGAGGEEILDPQRYKLRKDTHRPQIEARGGLLATIPDGGGARLTLEAGFGSSWLDVPADLREAVFLLAAHYYENRSDASGSGGLMPHGVMALLERHRNIRVLGPRR